MAGCVPGGATCHRRSAPPARVAVAAFALVTAWAASAQAQAWVPRAGQGSVTLALQQIENTGHVLSDGSVVPAGKSRNGSIYLEVDYAISDRVSISAGIPYVFAKYLGPPPPPGQPEPPMVQDVDRCYCWQHDLQDFGFTLRFNLLNGATALTPSVSAGVPSHAYDYAGEAVVGRGLRELRLAVDLGRRLDFVSRRLVVQGRYSHAWVESAVDVTTDRSNFSAELAFEAADGFVVRAGAWGQVTHGGLRAGLGPAPQPDGIPWGEITTPELFHEHDRLLRDNYWRIGAGLEYSLAGVDLFASYTEFVGGSDTHDGRAFTAGLSIPFSR